MREKDLTIIGRNSVAEAISSGHAIREILIQDTAKGLEQILSAAAAKGIPVRKVARKELEALAGGGKHQGTAAVVSGFSYADVSAMLALARKRGEDPFLILLDGIEDPHNLGAILRTADCAGAHGVVIVKHGGASVTETVGKTSAGAVWHVPLARVNNLTRTIGELKEQGLWIGACDMGEKSCYETDLTGPLALVIGNEGKGISRLVKQQCDFTVSIPLKGHVDSLNASNAAAVIMYEVLRQRND